MKTVKITVCQECPFLGLEAGNGTLSGIFYCKNTR
ncbi:unnamed protein product, partial [marine sediment metagenome]